MCIGVSFLMSSSDDVFQINLIIYAFVFAVKQFVNIVWRTMKSVQFAGLDYTETGKVRTRSNVRLN